MGVSKPLLNMTQLPTHDRPSASDVFHERCKARARLVAASMMSLQDAVDGLQAAAIEYGLIAEFGIDWVQAQMAAYFRDVPR